MLKKLYLRSAVLPGQAEAPLPIFLQADFQAVVEGFLLAEQLVQPGVQMDKKS